MKALVTGSSGFIGAYLVRALQRQNHTVVGLDRVDPSWHAPDSFTRADLLDATRATFAGIDRVYHLAAAKNDWGVSRREYFRDNVEATAHAVRMAESTDVGDVVFFSTVGVLGSGPDAKLENHRYNPMTPYAESKVEAEKLVAQFAGGAPGRRVVVVRPSAVFGPRHPPTTNVFRLIEALRKKRFVMVGTGRVLKTTSFLDNLIEATLFLSDCAGAGLNIYHYVDHPVLTTRELITKLCVLLGIPRPSWHVPVVVATATAGIADLTGRLLHRDISVTSARIRKFCTPTNYDASAIRRIGFAPPTSNDGALEQTVTWQLQHVQR